MSNWAALGLALFTFVISAAIGGIVCAVTGSQEAGWVGVLVALNPVWLIVARFLDPRQIRWR